MHRALLEELLGRVGPGSVIMPRLQCSYGRHIALGSNVFVNSDVLLMDDATITVADDVRIGPRRQLLTELHPVEDHERRRAGRKRTSPVVIGENSWIGAGAIICPT